MRTLRLLLALLVLSAPTPLLAAAGDITTVAGGPGQGPALSVAQEPGGVAVSGTLVYVADYWNNVVRRVDTTTGSEIVVAGNGTAGFSGDGGPATSAQLNDPRGVAVDTAGNLFIADSDNNRIRKVDTAGTITTVAGTGTAGFSGDGGPATSAQLYDPYGVAVDTAGNLFIADTRNHRIRKVDTAGTITTVAGRGYCDPIYGCNCEPIYGCTGGFSGDGGPATSAQLNDPRGVAVDTAGNLFIADSDNNRIRKVDTAGTITTVAGGGRCDPIYGCAGFSGDGGPATGAQLAGPSGVAVDTAGNLFIADLRNDRIRKVDAAGTITTVAGNGSAGFSGDGGPATGAQLAGPSGVAVDAAGNLFIADDWNHRIRKVDTAGTISTVAGNGSPTFSGDGGPATSAQLYYASGVAVDAAGNLFIADDLNHRIRKVDTAGTITTVAGNGTGGFSGGGFSGDGGPATKAQLDLPYGVAVDPDGNLFIADTYNNRIRMVDTAGTITTVAGNGSAGVNGDGGPAISAQLDSPLGVAVDTAGNLFIAEWGNDRIRKVDTAGTITTVAGNGTAGFSGDGGPATSAQLNNPRGVAVDTAGNLFIADADNNRIRKVDTASTITTVAGNGTAGFSGDGGPAASAQLYDPSGVAVDTAGNLFIADDWNNRVRIVDTAGTITTVAGNGSLGFSGDGGPATSAQLYFPSGVAVDTAGNLFIADDWNNRIRMIEGSTPTCVGDCNNDSHVTVDDILTMVNIALGNAEMSQCEIGDANNDHQITVDEILTAVNNALSGCPLTP